MKRWTDEFWISTSELKDAWRVTQKRMFFGMLLISVFSFWMGCNFGRTVERRGDALEATHE
jgi:hypothetical protein